MWASLDVCRLLTINLGCLQNNVGSRPWILSTNLGSKSLCLQVATDSSRSGRALSVSFRSIDCQTPIQADATGQRGGRRAPVPAPGPTSATNPDARSGSRPGRSPGSDGDRILGVAGVARLFGPRRLRAAVANGAIRTAGLDLGVRRAAPSATREFFDVSLGTRRFQRLGQRSPNAGLPVLGTYQ